MIHDRIPLEQLPESQVHTKTQLIYQNISIYKESFILYELTCERPEKYYLYTYNCKYIHVLYYNRNVPHHHEH